MLRHPNDLAAEVALADYDSQACPNGHHPDVVGKVRPQWILCEVCQMVEQAEADRPKGAGYFLTLTDRPPDEDDEEAAAGG
jgi:hypothetical protein